MISRCTVAGTVKYYLVILGAKDVAKLAQRDTEALKAALELAERKGVKREEEPKRLSAAESPPLLSEAPAVKLKEKQLIDNYKMVG